MTGGLCLGTVASAAMTGQDGGSDLSSQFLTPPDSARPWVYWFWLNGNITTRGHHRRPGGDEARGHRRRADHGGRSRAPVGPVAFMGPQWRELFQHVVAEAGRLGLEVNMNNDAGWNGSGGPWIKPEQSMQKVVWSETAFAGPKHVEAVAAAAGDRGRISIATSPCWRFRRPASYRIENIQVKAALPGRADAGPAASQRARPAGTW